MKTHENPMKPDLKIDWARVFSNFARASLIESSPLPR